MNSFKYRASSRSRSGLWERILFAYYPGMEGGGALADILFGKVNPSGKLPFAIAQNESDYPDIKWNTKAQHYGYYHSEKLFKDTFNR